MLETPTKADCIRAATDGDVSLLRRFFSQFKSDGAKVGEESPESSDISVVALRELYATLFQEAIANGQLDIVRELMEMPSSPLLLEPPASRRWILSDFVANAVVEDYPDIVEYLLEQGADVNGEVDFSGFDNGSDTERVPVLILAARLGSLEIAQVLVKHGADVNVRDKALGRTALHEAARQGDEDMIQYLVQCGCDIDVADLAQGETPLLVAVKSGKKNAVGMLLRHKANVAVTNKRGSCAVHIANVEGHHQILALLASAGANTTRPSTPLH